MVTPAFSKAFSKTFFGPCFLVYGTRRSTNLSR